MAISRKASAPVQSTTEKLTVSERLGVIHLSVVSTKKNSNDKEYIATPFGAVYARLTEVKPGLHSVVKLSNGAIALNNPTTEDRMSFINDMMQKYPNFTAQDIRSEFGL